MKNIIVNTVQISFAIAAITMASCDKSPKPSPVHAEEEIEKILVHFIPYDASGIETIDTITIHIDESGISSPAVVNLQSFNEYKMIIDPHSHEGSIASEIMEEGDEHQFFFIPNPSSAITAYEYLDADADGKGIGLKGKAVIADQDFDLNIILKHGLDKNHPNAANYNDIEYHLAGGGEDINVSIAIEVE